jgi:hypothetical protein
MKRWLTLLKFTTLGLTLAVLTPSAAVGKPGGTDRPVHGTGSGTTSVNLAARTATFEGTARISHLGKSTYHLDRIFTFAPPGSVTLVGTFTVVAANGDRLVGTFTGPERFTSTGPEFTFVLTISGGGGRFADATGKITANITSVIVSIVGGTAVLRDTPTFLGQVSY